MKKPKQAHEHQDPHRFPKLQQPIEKEMEDLFEVGIRKTLVDVTKVLVDQVKKKK